MAAGNINISSMSAETFALSAGSQAAKVAQEAAMREQEIARKARSVVVPTNDNLVRKRLRELGEPITLFGERVSRTHMRAETAAAAFLFFPLCRPPFFFPSPTQPTSFVKSFTSTAFPFERRGAKTGAE
jgi:hypothetical protein